MLRPCPSLMLAPLFVVTSVVGCTSDPVPVSDFVLSTSVGKLGGEYMFDGHTIKVLPGTYDKDVTLSVSLLKDVSEPEYINVLTSLYQIDMPKPEIPVEIVLRNKFFSEESVAMLRNGSVGWNSAGIVKRSGEELSFKIDKKQTILAGNVISCSCFSGKVVYSLEQSYDANAQRCLVAGRNRYIRTSKGEETLFLGVAGSFCATECTDAKGLPVNCKNSSIKSVLSREDDYAFRGCEVLLKARCVANKGFVKGFVIGGTTSGNNGNVEVRLNKSQRISVKPKAASFQFLNPLAQGESYDVEVVSSSPQIDCSVEKGKGVVGDKNVLDLKLTCVPTKIRVTGTLSDMGANKTMALFNAATMPETLKLTKNGRFEFTQAQPIGQKYKVIVNRNPAGQECIVTKGAGTILGGATEVKVLCSERCDPINNDMRKCGLSDACFVDSGSCKPCEGLSDKVACDAQQSCHWNGALSRCGGCDLELSEAACDSKATGGSCAWRIDRCGRACGKVNDQIRCIHTPGCEYDGVGARCKSKCEGLAMGPCTANAYCEFDTGVCREK